MAPKQSKPQTRAGNTSETAGSVSTSAEANPPPEPTSPASDHLEPGHVPVTESLLDTITAAVTKAVTDNMAKFEGKIDNMARRLDKTMEALQSLSNRQTEAEERISHLEDDLGLADTRLTNLVTKYNELREKMLDQECRQRRDNIKILNLKEAAEGSDPLTFFERFIPSILQLKVPSLPIVRVYRGYGASGEGRARPVTLKLLHSRDVTTIMEAAKRRGILEYEGCSIRFVRDTPPEVRALRRAFNKVCGTLIQRNIRFRMSYPATLSFQANGTQKTFKSAMEAEEFLSSFQ